MEILACPIDHAAMQLAITLQEEDEIIAGALTCESCGEIYPIVDGIPNLLPAELR